MRIPDFRKLMVRCFPGLGGYHTVQYAKVIKIHEKSGTHTRSMPVCCMDIHILDSDLTIDRTKKAKPNVEILRVARHIVDIPRVGDTCVLSFPFWQANTAILMGVLYEKHQVEPKEGVFRLTGADEVELNALSKMTIGSGEDFAVLALKLKESLIDIWDLVVQAASSGNLGAPLTNLGSAQTAWNTVVKPGLDDFFSDVKLGKEVKL